MRWIAFFSIGALTNMSTLKFTQEKAQLPANRAELIGGFGHPH
jgi:hypothetical protein